ncbi:MAG: MFS transporter [Novosphingobium sp.]|nr:MFS transporter [Novosphingobium sp.]
MLEQAITRARRRLLPFLLLMYVLAFLDRANIGFAKESFQASTAISDGAYALGAGLFFLTYSLFEIPSNLIMHRIGARLWMCRIMVSWGLISAAMALVTSEMSFYILRLLLGAAEAGFFPGVILYLTYWFPDRVRGQMMGLFYFGAPAAFIVGGPLSGLLLEMDGFAGFLGWQWMFLIEGLLASAVGIWAYFYLNNGPADAKWLPEDERQALAAEIARENHARARAGPVTLSKTVLNPRVALFVSIYFLIQMSVYGVIFYLPTQVGAMMGRKVGFEVGVVTAIPWICAMIVTFLLTRWADRSRKHRSLAVAALLMSAAGIAISADSPPFIALIALCLAASGFIAAQPLFWTFPTSYLGGAAAAGGIALINALGALGGFVAPNVKTWAEGNFDSSDAGLYLLAVTTVIGALLFLAIRQTGAAASPAHSVR